MSSAAIKFDKLAYLDRLKSGGVDERAARAHAEALDIALGETVATKADIEKLDAKIDGVEARLDAKIEAVEARLDAKIEAVEARLDAKIDALDAKIDATAARLEASTKADVHEAKAELSRQLFHGLVALTGVIVALNGATLAIMKLWR